MAFTWNPSAPSAGQPMYQTQITGIKTAADNNITVFCSAKDSTYYSSQLGTNYGTYYATNYRTYRSYEGHNRSQQSNRDSYNNKNTYYGGYFS